MPFFNVPVVLYEKDRGISFISEEEYRRDRSQEERGEQNLRKRNLIPWMIGVKTAGGKTNRAVS